MESLSFAVFLFFIVAATPPAWLCVGLGIAGTSVATFMFRRHIRPLPLFFLTLAPAVLLPALGYVGFILVHFLLASPGESRGFYFLFFQLALAWSVALGVLSFLTLRNLRRRLASAPSRASPRRLIVSWLAWYLPVSFLLFPVVHWLGLEVL